ncbi:hypothetical protein C4K14_2170 [Pseudomonas chlororaphis subsp. aureofaciens]|uniref:hypothetical protein n=1 Tax=Pseudomonas chlororaphis TaxID=587753 RepID=UPI000F55BD5B|nr:hypothetical protein [Pseudomonas chlororaphis]AZD85004.1 hypothetical protein C4K14_2170 [Pseudomonas chlororaphis subsp. aureofaciens]
MKAQKIYLYSTLSNDQSYTSYQQVDGGAPQPVSSILVHGKANVSTKQFVTPRGTATEVTAEQLAELRTNDVFKLHVKNGFITISQAKEDAEKVAADMTGRDQSAPLVEQDFADGEAPVTNAKKKG